MFLARLRSVQNVKTEDPAKTMTLVGNEDPLENGDP